MTSPNASMTGYATPTTAFASGGIHLTKRNGYVFAHMSFKVNADVAANETIATLPSDFGATKQIFADSTKGFIVFNTNGTVVATSAIPINNWVYGYAIWPA